MDRWRDWYGQGKRGPGKAGLDFENECCGRACFPARQASEKAIEAAALKSGITVWGRSLAEIPGIFSSKVPVPPGIPESAKLPDIYFLRHAWFFPRYHNG